jgi:hypothetical protein
MRYISSSQIRIMIIKIIIAISIASLIYSLYKNISMSDVKIAIAFLEAKFFGLFTADYKISYVGQYGIKLERKIQYFLSDQYVLETLAKYKFALYESLLLALYIQFAMIILIHYLWFEIRIIVENVIYKASIANHQSETKVIAQKKDKKSSKLREFQDI